MKGHKNTGKKENNGLKSKKGNIILLVLLLLILLVVPCFALGASIGDDVKVHFNSSEHTLSVSFQVVRIERKLAASLSVVGSVFS